MTTQRKPEEVLDMLYALELIESAKIVIKNHTFRSGRLSGRREALFYEMYDGSNRDNFVPPRKVFKTFHEVHHIESPVVRRYASDWYKIVSLTLELSEARRIRKYDCFRETIDKILFPKTIDEEVLEGVLFSDGSLIMKLSSENERYVNKVAESENLDIDSALNSILDAKRLSDS